MRARRLSAADAGDASRWHTPRVSSLRLDARPRTPGGVLVAAFRGWNDAGNAASIAAGFLRARYADARFGVIDPDDYVDFQETRPRVLVGDDGARQIEWPETELHNGALPDGRGLVVCTGPEPNLRWRRYASELLEVVRLTEVSLVVTLGGLLADTPHSRPVPVTGSAYAQETIDRLGLRRSTYEGPTGIVGVLHDACGAAGVESVSLWAAVPHYIGGNPNPSAGLALAQRLGRLLAVDLAPAELESASAEFDRQVATQVETDPDVLRYVRELEQASDEGDDQEWEAAENFDDAPRSLPSGDDLEQDIQRFLRERQEGDEPEA